MKSWKTTLFGALAALAAYLSAQEGGVKIAGQILGGVSIGLMGIFARDNNVTSEQVGAGK